MIASLLYDVGMYMCQYKEFYLREGFRVGAIEADPDFVRMVRDGLSTDVESGRLTILGVELTTERDSLIFGSTLVTTQKVLASRRTCFHGPPGDAFESSARPLTRSSKNTGFRTT